MQTRSVQLVDPSGAVLVTARVADEGGYFGGTVELGDTPAELRALFDEFEEVVNGQMFVFLDDIQARIGAHALRAVFEDGDEVPIKDLQVFPSTGDISFRAAPDGHPTAASPDLRRG
jgi:hypothetical protein